MKTHDPITDINLKILQTFVLVAEHRSFRHAANMSVRSQSAVSNQIKQLEDQLQVRLFNRTTRSVELTPEGVQLLASAKLALGEISHCIRDIRETVDIKRGRVSLACSPTIAATKLPAILSVFESDFPEALIVVRELNPRDLTEALRAGEVDFAIGPDTGAPDLRYETILSESLIALVPDNLYLNPPQEMPLRNLADMPLLLLNSASALRRQVEACLESQGFEIEPKYEFSQAHTLISMSRQGLGVALLPECLMVETEAEGFSVVRVADEELVRNIAIITRSGYEFTPTVNALAKRVRELIDGRKLLR